MGWASAYLHQHHGRRRAKSSRLHFGERCHGTVSHSHQLRAQRCTQQHSACARRALHSSTTSGRRALALPNVGYTRSEENVNILSQPLVQLAVGAVRVGVPLLHRRLVAGVLRLLLEVGGACIVAGRRPWQTCRGGEPNPACIHEYTVFSRVFSHGSNTRIIRVNTYSEYVFTT